MTGKKFRFNIIDALILLILLAAGAVLAYVFVLSDTTLVKGENHTVEYVVEVTSVNEIFKDSVKEGDKVTLASDRKKELGEISKKPESYASVKTGFNNETGEEEYSFGDGLVDMVITFRGETEKTEWGYSNDDVYILVNDSIELIFGDFKGTATCIEVTVLD